jgi:crotonobetainyl-CoA:carnitine CoA-transferase CaiB-like acyl-CoA transferase
MSEFFTNAQPALEALWQQLNLPAGRLQHTQLTGSLPVLASSFAVSTAAQSSIAAAASAASLIANQRSGKNYNVTVNADAAAMECTSEFTINGSAPSLWAELSGLYKTSDGYLRVHANFDHHRDCLLNALQLPAGTNKTTVESAVAQCSTSELDTAITELGGACAALRTFEQWNRHPQAAAISGLPLIEITRIGDAPARELCRFDETQGALNGTRVLDLTRILAGPVCGKTLAAYGADVMLINSPHLPNIEAIIETSHGKLSAHCDLKTAQGVNALHTLLKDTHIFVQGYRPGSLASLGVNPEALCREYPGLITVSLSAYGNSGPWCQKRGFDSLVQTATGFNAAEAEAFGSAAPKPMPVQILDYASGFLMAFGAQAALYKQLTEGGSYHVQLSLARTALWLKEMGQSRHFLNVDPPQPGDYLRPFESGYGTLEAIPHAAVFDDLPNHFKRPSVAPGTDALHWPPAGN